MSGSFELIPNPTILAVQTGMFFVAATVVKKLYVDPYRKLKERRLAKTSIGDLKGIMTLDEFEAKKSQILSKVATTRASAQEVIERTKKLADTEREKMISEAKSKIDSDLTEKLRVLRTDYQSESDKVAAIAENSAQKMLKILLGNS